MQDLAQQFAKLISSLTVVNHKLDALPTHAHIFVLFLSILKQSSTIDSIQSDVKQNYKLVVKIVTLVVDFGSLIQTMLQTDLVASSISLPIEMNHLLKVQPDHKFGTDFVRHF